MYVLLGKDHLVIYRIIKALITSDFFPTPSVSTAYCIPPCGDVNINRNSSLNLNRVNICCGLLNYLKKFTTVIWLVVRKMSLNWGNTSPTLYNLLFSTNFLHGTCLPQITTSSSLGKHQTRQRAFPTSLWHWTLRCLLLSHSNSLVRVLRWDIQDIH